ncbi:MAG: DoxX family protein [Pseudonocardiaceae bacterium]
MRRIPPVRASGTIQSLFRVVVGFLFACHGAAALFGILGGAHGQPGGAVPFGDWPSWWAAVIQLAGGALVALGLGTRTAALICSGSMAYAYFTVHQDNGMLPIENGGELAALYSWLFLLIVVLGPGSIALDSCRQRHRPSPAESVALRLGSLVTANK